MAASYRDLTKKVEETFWVSGFRGSKKNINFSSHFMESYFDSVATNILQDHIKEKKFERKFNEAWIQDKVSSAGGYFLRALENGYKVKGGNIYAVIGAALLFAIPNGSGLKFDANSLIRCFEKFDFDSSVKTEESIRGHKRKMKQAIETADAKRGTPVDVEAAPVVDVGTGTTRRAALGDPSDGLPRPRRMVTSARLRTGESDVVVSPKAEVASSARAPKRRAETGEEVRKPGDPDFTDFGLFKNLSVPKRARGAVKQDDQDGDSERSVDPAPASAGERMDYLEDDGRMVGPLPKYPYLAGGASSEEVAAAHAVTVPLPPELGGPLQVPGLCLFSDIRPPKIFDRQQQRQRLLERQQPLGVRASHERSSFFTAGMFVPCDVEGSVVVHLHSDPDPSDDRYKFLDQAIFIPKS